MSHAALPQPGDLNRLLVSAGMIVAPPSDVQQMLDVETACTAAAAEWSKITGYTPFLGNSADVLRKYDPPGPVVNAVRYGWRSRGGQITLHLDNGLISLTSVTIAVDTNSTGTVLTLGRDFYLEPANAPTEIAPWDTIRFIMPVWGTLQSVQILGKWGYGVQVPDDAWNAILYMAAFHLLAQLDFSSFGALLKWGDADANETYREKPFGNMADLWQARIDRAQNNYLRDVV